MTRPAIYNYFETKEEILLGLLIREYDSWCKALEAVADTAAEQNCSSCHRILHIRLRMGKRFFVS